MNEPTEEARWHARWFQICMSAGVRPDADNAPDLLVDAILEANSYSRLIALKETVGEFLKACPYLDIWPDEYESLAKAHAAAQEQDE